MRKTASRMEGTGVVEEAQRTGKASRLLTTRTRQREWFTTTQLSGRKTTATSRHLLDWMRTEGGDAAREVEVEPTRGEEVVVEVGRTELLPLENRRHLWRAILVTELSLRSDWATIHCSHSWLHES